MRLRFSAPWGFSDRRNLAEGETLDIPIHYEVRNPDASADYRITMTLLFGNFGASLGPQARTVHRTPDSGDLEIRPGSPATGTVDFQISTDVDGVSQGDVSLRIQFDVARISGSNVGGTRIMDICGIAEVDTSSRRRWCLRLFGLS